MNRSGIANPYPREAQKQAAAGIVAGRKARNEAASTVRQTLVSCLPPGVPPSFSEVLAARFVGTGTQRTIVATLVMFDGRSAEVTLRPWAMGWSHQFTFMPGGPVSFEDGAWRRVGE